MPVRSNTTAFKSYAAVLGNGIHHAAKLSTRNPIEMFVGVLILASFSYFYLFNLARTSDIFSGTHTRLYPATAYAAPHGQFQTDPVPFQAEPVRLQLKQIAVDARRNNKHVDGQDIMGPALDRFQATLQNDIFVPDDDRRAYSFSQGLCYLDTNGECFTHVQQDTEKTTLSYVFDVSGSAWRRQLANMWASKVAHLPPGDLVSQANSGQGADNIFVWLFVITRNIIYRLKELIDVSLFPSLSFHFSCIFESVCFVMYSHGRMTTRWPITLISLSFSLVMS